MTSNSKNFCVLPWVSIETSPIGTLRPCCLAEDELVHDQTLDKFKINIDSIETARNSSQMKTLRQQFIDGERPDTCKKCWAVEDSGGTSKREHTLDRLKHMGIKDQEWTTDARPLMFIDFKLGNICNLKCRICGSWSSSTYAIEEIQQLPTSIRKKSFPYKMIDEGRWPRQSVDFWKEMGENASNIRYLEFTGGEPFMIREHFDFLETLIEKGVAKDIEVHYNTNGTNFPDAKHIWKHFKLVEIAFSIDDVGPRFEYQRKNAKWDEVNVNMAKFKELKQELGNIVLQVCSTVNVFNVMYLEGLSEWIDQQEFDFVYWNMLHEVWYHSIARLPEQAKTQAIEKLTHAEVSEFHKEQFKNIIMFMEQGQSSDGQELVKTTQKTDRIRGELLSEHHPELAEAIGYE